MELTFLLPLVIMLLGGMFFLVYAGWQDLKVQQAANLAARVEGQEKVNGGRTIYDINKENGFGPGMGRVVVNPDVKDATMEISNDNSVGPLSGQSLYDRLRVMVKGLYAPGERSSVQIESPLSGQSVDQVNVYRILKMPHIPFFKDKANPLPESIMLKGTAYGGEDPFMYALPRWGTTNEHGNTPEWYILLKDARTNP